MHISRTPSCWSDINNSAFDYTIWGSLAKSKELFSTMLILPVFLLIIRQCISYIIWSKWNKLSISRLSCLKHYLNYWSVISLILSVSLCALTHRRKIKIVEQCGCDVCMKMSSKIYLSEELCQQGAVQLSIGPES